jgi:hypothetical protein
LTYANVMVTLLAFVVLGGGAAYAANTIRSGDIVDGEVKTPDLGADSVASGKIQDRQVKNADLGLGASSSNTIADGGIQGIDVKDENLTGADIKDQSGVDTCVSTTRIGQLCVRAENFARPWDQALRHCANLDLRMPSLGEAMELAQTHDIPNVDPTEPFWTEETVFEGSTFYSYLVTDDGGFVAVDQSLARETVCVTTPTN